MAYSRPENYPIPPTSVHITLGGLKINQQQPAFGQPALARAIRRIDVPIRNLQSKVLWLRVPAGGFAVNVTVARNFVPDDFDHRGDKRQLGVQLTYRFTRTRPHR